MQSITQKPTNLLKHRNTHIGRYTNTKHSLTITHKHKNTHTEINEFYTKSKKHTNIHLHIHTHSHTPKQTITHKQIHTYIQTYIQTYKHTHKHTLIKKNTQTQT